MSGIPSRDFCKGYDLVFPLPQPSIYNKTLIPSLASRPIYTAVPETQPSRISIPPTTQGCIVLHSSDVGESLTRRGQFQIPVPQGSVVTTAQEAKDVVSSISQSILIPLRSKSFTASVANKPSVDAPSVVKAQVLAGGRGKGKFNSDGKGGVRIVSSLVYPICRNHRNLTYVRQNEAFETASNMLGYNLTTKQTPPGGLLVTKLYIYKSVDIADEFYVAITFDRDRYMPVLLISDDGGVNIECNASRLQRFWFNLSHGITPEITSYIQAQFGFSDKEMAPINHILHQMVKLFQEKDATLLELNPLVRTPDNELFCLDAKFNFDNSAKFRQQELFALKEQAPGEEDEHQASQLGLSYVRLDGNIGNVVNGAGLAMATNDLVTLFGGKCANFLDVGGGATKETLSKAFDILERDMRIKGILVNIYGGKSRHMCGAIDLLLIYPRNRSLQYDCRIYSFCSQCHRRLQGASGCSSTGYK